MGADGGREMVTMREMHAADLAEVEPDMDDRFTWQGQDYPAIVDHLAQEAGLGMGGFSGEADLVLIVRREHYMNSVEPIEEQTIVWPAAKSPNLLPGEEGKTYRIKMVRKVGGSLVLECKQKDS